MPGKPKQSQSVKYKEEEEIEGKFEEERRKFEEEKKKFEEERKIFEEQKKKFQEQKNQVLVEEPINESASSAANIQQENGIMVCWEKTIKHNIILKGRHCSKDRKQADQEKYELRNNVGSIPISLFCEEFNEFEENIERMGQEQALSCEMYEAVARLNAALTNTFRTEEQRRNKVLAQIDSVFDLFNEEAELPLIAFCIKNKWVNW